MSVRGNAAPRGMTALDRIRLTGPFAIFFFQPVSGFLPSLCVRRGRSTFLAHANCFAAASLRQSFTRCTPIIASDRKDFLEGIFACARALPGLKQVDQFSCIRIVDLQLHSRDPVGRDCIRNPPLPGIQLRGFRDRVVAKPKSQNRNLGRTPIPSLAETWVPDGRNSHRSFMRTRKSIEGLLRSDRASAGCSCCSVMSRLKAGFPRREAKLLSRAILSRVVNPSCNAFSR